MNIVITETRVDAETGEWRLSAPRRADRPGPASPGCPFCPGHESETPPERLRVPADGGPWRVRAFANKYPIVSPGGEGGVTATGLFPQFPATGEHEVLVESPAHDWDLRQASSAQALDILTALRSRCQALGARRPAAVVVFRNYGVAAGASLRHPHSQLVALDQAPPGLVARWRLARGHYTDAGRRLIDDLAEAERAAGERVVFDSGVLVYQPYAASVPQQTVLVPSDGRGTLASATDEGLASVARALPPLLRGLADVLDDPAYNLVVHAGPADVEDREVARWWQWHVEIQPRTTTFAGLELATGLLVNPSRPEETAPALAKAMSAAAG
ncbi:galactose-1-phosphate uridylyltransferase [Asanoa iriomotensis]|uniref:Galactose-1-phosphate uridylyltransferase n=1 Tax=Asanoa iriomotensis TaxID=234613 RepID=A0ABQ4CCK1_9ACTN|nr:galactose-1-phosphate uridylyltransferase [Asanoa iriomotensis]